MNIIDITHERCLVWMLKSVHTLANLVKTLTQEQAKSWTDEVSADGSPGWSILQVLCHVRDFDEIFYQRAQMIRSVDRPALPAYDHLALAEDRNYQGQDLVQVMDSLVASRYRFHEFFQSLSAEEWGRAGVHPEAGEFSLSRAALQVVGHDIDHTEQITKIIARAQQATASA
jgi:uncharacterized damage-inducible protein DinB